MIDITSAPTVLTVSLPADLVEELHAVANNQGRPVSEVVREACLAYVEPFFWERVYQEGRSQESPA